MPNATIGGAKINWQIWGEAKAPRQALLVHCALAHSGVWARLAGGLSADMGLCAFDMPGHGGSAPWDRSKGFQDQTTDMALKLARHIYPPDQPIDLIGHSFGATVALRLALEGQLPVRSVTLIEPVLFAAAKRANDPRYAAYMLQAKPMFAAKDAGDKALAIRLFTDIWGAGVPWDMLTQAQQDDLIRRADLISAGENALFDDMGGLLDPGGLEDLQCPCLLLEGGQSHPVVPAVLDVLEKRLNTPRRVVVKQAAHMLPITHPRPVTQALRDFLSL